MLNYASVSTSDEAAIQLMLDRIKEGQLTATFQFITDEIRRRHSQVMVHPMIRQLVKALNRTTSECCHTSVKVQGAYEFEEDSYSIVIRCQHCNRTKLLHERRRQVTFKELRKKAGLSTEEVSAATGLHTRTIERAEIDYGSMHLIVGAKLCWLYQVAMNDVYFGKASEANQRRNEQ